MDEQTKRYRMLEPGEVVQEGDEVGVQGEWYAATISVGQSIAPFETGFYRRPIDDLWAPTQSQQTMPDGLGESFEAYRAKLVGSAS